MSRLEVPLNHYHAWPNCKTCEQIGRLEALAEIESLQGQLAVLKAQVEQQNDVEVELRAEADRLDAESVKAWDENVKLKEQLTQAKEALKEIQKGEGPFSCDPLTHAANTIKAK